MTRTESRAKRPTAAFVAAAVVFLCGGALGGCPLARGPLQGVRVSCNRPDARVFVDGRFMGEYRQLKGRVIRLKSGVHLIEFRRQGFFARYRQIRVGRGQIQDVDVRLYRELE